MNLFAQTSTPDVNYTTQIQTARHSIIADEDQATGGRDEGPTPREMLLASLASCTAITLKMYIARKDWPIKNVDVRVELVESEDKKAPPRIKRVLRFPDDMDPSQAERLIQVANACPVHKLLNQTLQIDTQAG